MSYELMFQNAINAYQNGDLTEAEKLLRQIHETAPENADVLNLLGLVAQAKGIHYEAASYFYLAAKFAPQHFPIFFNLAISLVAVGRLLEAQEALHNALKLKPDLKEAYLGLGNIFWQQNNLTEAKKMFRQALELDNLYVDAQTNLAELEDDVSTLKKLAQNNNFTALYYLGRRAFSLHNFAEAADYLTRADSLNENDEIKTLLGQSLLFSGHKEKAQNMFAEAAQLNAHNAQAMVHLADLLAEKQSYKEAEQFYKKALDADKNNLQAHTNYANMLCKCKRTLEALEEYRQAVIISPQTPELSYNLAIILKTLGEYEDALYLMFNAFYLDTTHVDWSLSLVETLILLNQQSPEKAQKITQNWLEKMPDNLPAQHIYALLHNQKNEHEQAYNKLLFDNFAPVYETTLQNIHYAVVEKIAELSPKLTGVIVDLGCGTGLVAEKLKTPDNQFIGVDLSEKMLELAAAKNIYAQLKCDDIVNYLQTAKPKCAALIAADVLCYFGDLAEIIRLCAPQRLIFSIETTDKVAEYQVQVNGRYQHNPDYITKLLQNSGYRSIKQKPLVLRQEGGQDVNGIIFLADS